jgi:hypothetical protein
MPPLTLWMPNRQLIYALNFISYLTENIVYLHCTRKPFFIPKKSNQCLTFCGPCIMILLRTKDQQDAFFKFIYFNSHHLYVLNRLAIHHQEVALLNVRHMVFIMHLCWLAARENAIIEIIEIKKNNKYYTTNWCLLWKSHGTYKCTVW